MGLAGHSFAVACHFSSTAHYCARYPATASPEVTLSVTAEACRWEQQRLREEALREGLRPRQFSDPFLERSVLQGKAAAYLRQFDIFLLHGSTVAMEGRAYLFTARCGTGKSTHTRLWREAFGPRAVMVNDDRPFLQLTEGSVLAWGSPWSGKHGLDANICVPLAGICLLERGRENSIVPLPPEAALPFLHTQAEPEDLPLVNKLAATVPLWRMACTPTPQAAQLAHQAMANW